MIWIKKIKNIDLFYENLQKYTCQGPFRLNIFNPWQDFYVLTKGVYYSKDIKKNILKLYYESGWETRGGVPSSLKSYFVSKIFVKGEKGYLFINEPFAVINADDFYGRDSFAVIGRWLSEMDGKTDRYCMVGYRVGNTLSESGSVSRGVCSMDDSRMLTDVVERTRIERIDGVVKYCDENDQWVSIDDNTPVSMNMWGFTPDYFVHSDEAFVEFLNENIGNLKSEFYIPFVVNNLIKRGTSTVEVLDTTAAWFGVTYAQDRPSVVAKIQALVDAGEYPDKLF